MIYNRNSAFSVIEIIVGMVVFMISIGSIFLLIESVQSSARRTQAESVLLGLMREQIEVARMYRDRNWIAHDDFSTYEPTKTWESGVYVFYPSSTGGTWEKIGNIPSASNDYRNLLLDPKAKRCLTSNKQYQSCQSGGNPTPYSLLFVVEKQNEAFVLRSLGGSQRVNQIFELTTLLTNWKLGE